MGAFSANQPVHVQSWTSQVSVGVLVKVPPQGNLGGGEACVIRKSVGGTQLPLPGIRDGGCYLMVWRDGQIARQKFPLGVGPVKTGQAGAVDLHADAVKSRDRAHAVLRGVHVHGRAGIQVLSVWGAVTGAVGFELKQLLLPLSFLQLHYADLQTDTRGSHYTKETALYYIPDMSRNVYERKSSALPESYHLYSLGDKHNSS